MHKKKGVLVSTEDMIRPLFTEPGIEDLRNSFPYLEVTIITSTLIFLFKTYLNYRQHVAIQNPTFPSSLTSILKSVGLYENTLKKFNSSREYNYDKSVFNLFQSVIMFIIDVATLLSGYLPFIWSSCQQRLQDEDTVYLSLCFVLVTTVISIIIQLPFSVYSTFYIEAKHGFNKQTVGCFILDQIKSLGLVIVFGGIFVYGFIRIVTKFATSYFYLYLWGFTLSFQLIMMIIAPTVIMPLFNKFTPLPDGSLKTRIEELASSLKFPLSELFVCDGSTRSSHSNAYFFGLITKRIVLYDTLLQEENKKTDVTEDEVLAILSHELGHWKLGHTMQMFVFTQLQMLITFYVFSKCLYEYDLYYSFGFNPSKDALPPVIIGLTLFSSAIWNVVEFLLGIVSTLLVRRNEFQADEFAVSLNVETKLSSALVKISNENLSNLNPDALYSAIYYSHPPLLERLRAIDTAIKKLK